MSARELDRIAVLERISSKTLTQREAARILGISERQVRRLLKSFHTGGPAALACRSRGRVSNRRLPEPLKDKAVALVLERYPDFGPTFAQEKLEEEHGVRVSVSTLRSWMMEAGIWLSRAQRLKRPYQPRARRECYGELIQIDGSDHHWFEDRSPSRCTLLVFIDDATGALMELRFCESESTFNYFEAAKAYLNRHGKPVAFYSDKASVFRINAKDVKGGTGYTQFGRAMGELNIETICANTPQAKGRVERVNSTLQDRLVKEMRLKGISTINEANKFAEVYLTKFNARFARPALNPHNAHRPLRVDESLTEIFTWQEKRKVSRNQTLNYKRVLYLLEDSESSRLARGSFVDISETEDGMVVISHKGNELPARKFEKDGHVRQGAIVENKLLGAVLTHIKKGQEVRDAATLKSKAVRNRNKRLLKERQENAAAPG